MRIKVKYKLSHSETLSSSGLDLSRSGILASSMRRRPRLWILAALAFSVIFMLLLVALLQHNTARPDRRAWLTSYYSRMYGRVAPRDEEAPLGGFLRSSVRGVILILCRNEDLAEMAATLRNFEGRFNKKYAYPYLFLNDQEFSPLFQATITDIVAEGSGALLEFGRVPKEHWSYPEWIDQERASQTRIEMGQRGVLYGDSESYRFMCRYFSGFFYRHPLMQKYDYYWRVEPGVEFTCDINYDVFRFMKRAGKAYGFVIAIQEIPETVPTLWQTVLQEYLPRNPRLASAMAMAPSDSAIRFFGPPTPHGYNGCHFWSNFEVADLRFYRSAEYARLFEALDRAGGFFYERWGDAPVHSIAAGLLLKTEQIHYFYDIGYRHDPFSHCPSDVLHRKECNCDCDPFAPSEVGHGMCQSLWGTHQQLS